MPSQPDRSAIRPYYDTLDDGIIQLSFTLPLEKGEPAERAAREMLQRMNLDEINIAEQRSLDSQLTFFVAYARVSFRIDAGKMEALQEETYREHEVELLAKPLLERRLTVVGATLESDAHTVGLDAIFNAKGYAGHSGLEHYKCFRTLNLGAQVPFHRLIEVIRKESADAVLLSQTITQKGLHLKNLTRIADLLEAEGLRDKLILIVGGPNITPELAKELGFDAGFGRETLPEQVAAFLIQQYRCRWG